MTETREPAGLTQDPIEQRAQQMSVAERERYLKAHGWRFVTTWVYPDIITDRVVLWLLTDGGLLDERRDP